MTDEQYKKIELLWLRIALEAISISVVCFSRASNESNHLMIPEKTKKNMLHFNNQNVEI